MLNTRIEKVLAATYHDVSGYWFLSLVGLQVMIILMFVICNQFLWFLNAL